MNAPLVTAIIPAYNAAGTICRAIDSVLRQTYESIEIVVVNDGSTDETGDIVQRQYPQVIYREQNNAGPGAARNAAAEAASGHVVANLDADDEWLEDKVERQVQVLLEHPQPILVGTNAWYTIGSFRYLARSLRRPRLSEASAVDILTRRGPIEASIMMPRATLMAAGGYDESLHSHEDVDLLCRLMTAGHKLVYLSEPLYVVHRGPRSLSSTAARSEAIAGALLPILANLDPSALNSHHWHPLSPKQHARLMAEQVLRATRAALLEGRAPEEIRSRIPQLRDLERLPLDFSGLAWLQRHNWWVFARAVTLHSRATSLWRLLVNWGIVGGIRRRTTLRRVAAELRQWTS